MSYNIDHTKYLNGRLKILQSVARAFVQEHEEDLAEGCWLTDIPDEEDSGDADPIEEGAEPAEAGPDPDEEPVDIHSPSWYGVGSGRSEDTMIAALRLTTGSADILAVWEGGDSFSGYRVRDGVVTQHKVVQALGDEIK